MNGINYATTPPPSSLGFQPSGRSFGGNGGSGLGKMLLGLLTKGGGGPPTGAQTGALAAGAGPVSAGTGANMAATSPAAVSGAMTQAPFMGGPQGTPSMDYLNNPYYKTGFSGMAHY